jgi:hypothetical protein
MLLNRGYGKDDGCIMGQRPDFRCCQLCKVHLVPFLNGSKFYQHIRSIRTRESQAALTMEDSCLNHRGLQVFQLSPVELWSPRSEWDGRGPWVVQANRGRTTGPDHEPRYSLRIAPVSCTRKLRTESRLIVGLPSSGPKWTVTKYLVSFRKFGGNQH